MFERYTLDISIWLFLMIWTNTQLDVLLQVTLVNLCRSDNYSLSQGRKFRKWNVRTLRGNEHTSKILLHRLVRGKHCQTHWIRRCDPYILEKSIWIYVYDMLQIYLICIKCKSSVMDIYLTDTSTRLWVFLYIMRVFIFLVIYIVCAHNLWNCRRFLNFPVERYLQPVTIWRIYWCFK